MPSIISAGTTTGTALSLTSDTSGELQIRTNNGSTTAMTLTTGGNVGVGTTTPGGKLGVDGSVVVGNQAASGTAGTFGIAAVGSAVYLQTGQNTTSASAAPLVFTNYGAASEWMRITSTGNVGIGTSSPSSFSSLARNLVVNAATSAGITISESTGAGTASLLFAATSGFPNTANITRDYVSNSFQFGFNTTERMRFPAAGGVQTVTCVSVGNATPSETGAGITFPATQSASSDANTLDDYEEGNWTPIDSSGAGLNLSSNGTYVKVGRLVVCSFSLTFPSTANGALVSIGGLPFQIGNINGVDNGGPTGCLGYVNAAFIPQLHLTKATTTFGLYNLTTSLGNNSLSTISLRGTLTYQVA